MLTNTESTYGTLHRALHWLMALMVIGMIGVGMYIHDLDPNIPAEASVKMQLGGLHKATGMVILMLVALRLAWVLANGTPGLPGTVPRWQRIVAKATHHTMYLLMFAMPISGYVMSSYAARPVSVYGLFEIPPLFRDKNLDMAKAVFEVHETLATILIVLIVLHVAVALKHHFVDKDNILRRMLTGA